MNNDNDEKRLDLTEEPIDTSSTNEEQTEVKQTDLTEAEEAGFSEQELLEVESMEVEGAPQLEAARTPLGTSTLPPLGPPRKKHTKQILLASLGIIIVAGIGGTLFLLSQHRKSTASQPTQQEKTAPIVAPEQKEGISLTATIVEGTVLYQTNKNDWQPLSADTKLDKGTSVRTSADSRVTLTFENGSVIRLDQSSSVKIEGLEAADIKIQHLEGTAYSHIVSSDYRYTISTDDTTYNSQNSAFVTTNTADNKGVRVFQGVVKVNDIEVGEGKQYFTETTDATVSKNSITDIDTTTLSKDDFITWNTTEDVKKPLLKESLGILTELTKETNEEDKTSESSSQPQGQGTDPSQTNSSPTVN